MNLLALDLASVDSRVLLFEVVSEAWAIMSTVRLSKEAKIAAFVLGELGVEVLKELPDCDSGNDGRVGAVATVAETSASRLVNVELFKISKY